MTEQIRHFVDGAPLADEFRRQAVAHQMGASTAGNLDPTSLQSRLHDSRYRRTGPERPYRRHGAQENLLTIDPGSGMQNVMGERVTCFLHERYNAIASRLGPPHEDFGSAPADILELK